MDTWFDISVARGWLARAKRPLLFSHRRPDGDALGSLAGMAQICSALGASPTIALFEPFPSRYRLLAGGLDWRLFPGTAAETVAAWDRQDSIATPALDLAALGAADAVIVVDTCSLAQLEPAAAFLRNAPPTFVIDHHATRDPLAERPGDLGGFDAGASACCLMVAELAEALDIARTPALGTALFLGMATDTGWFRFSNTDGRTLRQAARMIDAGARPSEINAALFQQDAPAKVRLVGRLLSNLELLAGDELVVLRLRQADLAATGADRTMTEDLVNEVNRLRCSEATLLFSEESAGVIRVNFRSKRRLDVAAIAQRFGGGGHVRAAGARLTGDWDRETARVIGAVTEALKMSEQAGPGERPAL